jgi:hypothetical protein
MRPIACVDDTAKIAEIISSHAGLGSIWIDQLLPKSVSAVGMSFILATTSLPPASDDPVPGQAVASLRSPTSMVLLVRGADDLGTRKATDICVS